VSFDSRKAGRELVAISGAGKTTQHQHVHQRCSLLPVFLIFKVCVLFFPEYPFDTVPSPKKVEVLEDDWGTGIGYPGILKTWMIGNQLIQMGRLEKQASSRDAG